MALEFKTPSGNSFDKDSIDASKFSHEVFIGKRKRNSGRSSNGKDQLADYFHEIIKLRNINRDDIEQQKKDIRETLTAIKGIMRRLADVLKLKLGKRKFLLRLKNGNKVRELLKHINTLTSEKLREIFTDPEVSYLFLLLVPLMRKLPFYVSSEA